MPTALRIDKDIYRCIMQTIGAMPAETGGVLGGPRDSKDITEFHFDRSGRVSRSTYSPDVDEVNGVIRTWWNRGGTLRGFVHSHPLGVDRLSAGDLNYIERLLRKNDDMPFFVAPIVLPAQFRMCPFIVRRSAPRTPVSIPLELF